MNLEELKYPIGKFIKPNWISKEIINLAISDIKEFPNQVRKELENLDHSELNLRYRPEGWTISQVVSHCADSHMNSFIRFKLALTEDLPIIKPYEENLWAELSDYSLPPFASLKLLEALHEKWVFILKNLNERDLKREFIHPSQPDKISLEENILIYSWHSKHHLEHIKQAKKLKFQ